MVCFFGIRPGIVNFLRHILLAHEILERLIKQAHRSFPVALIFFILQKIFHERDNHGVLTSDLHLAGLIILQNFIELLAQPRFHSFSYCISKKVEVCQPL